MLSFAIAMAVLALVLYFELKNTQDRMESVRTEIEKRMNAAIEGVIHDATDKIPDLERRLTELSEKLEQKTESAEEPAAEPAPQAGKAEKANA